MTRAIGVSPWARAKASEVTTSALAPSFKPGALPAVTVPPSLRNAGFSLASVSAVVSRRGDFIGLHVVGPPFPGTCTGRISALNLPASIAAMAFRWLSYANASWSARVTPAFSAVYSAYSPMWQQPNESQRPSWIIPSTMVWFPALIPPRMP